MYSHAHIIPSMSTSKDGVNRFMQAASFTDRQGMEICENVGRLLVDELDKPEIWSRVEALVKNYLKNNRIDEDAAELTEKLEWSVKVRLKR
ncbi:MAG: hypothetical protein NWE92_06775 [Candidatus Bathyarchaeota archaeon]|nr:hypothetical protein [Candidatus Bathyarchaeota archaeon]